MNDIVQYKESRALTAADMRAQVNLVQEVMKAVMQGPSKENPYGVHYGTIPGTPKPTLYKAGAEVLAATFRIAVSYHTEDLSTNDAVRYRVTATGTHQTSGIVMGAGMGECSSSESKYKWRKASSNKEFDVAPVDKRRIQYGYNRTERQEFEIKQVRTDPADLANTVLKMACKRAQVAMILNVTAASDIFTQDIEDLPEELRPRDDGEKREEKKEVGPQPYPADKFTTNLPKWAKLIQDGKKTAEQIIATVSSNAVLSDEQKKRIQAVKKPTVIDQDTSEINGAPTVDEQALLKRLQTFTDVDVGDNDATLIGQVKGQDRQNLFAKTYQDRRAELTGEVAQ